MKELTILANHNVESKCLTLAFSSYFRITLFTEAWQSRAFKIQPIRKALGKRIINTLPFFTSPIQLNHRHRNENEMKNIKISSNISCTTTTLKTLSMGPAIPSFSCTVHRVYLLWPTATALDIDSSTPTHLACMAASLILLSFTNICPYFCPYFCLVPDIFSLIIHCPT